MNENKERRNKGLRAGKECAYSAVFVALVIAAQLTLSFLPGVELVTLLFVSYSFVFGWKRGMLAATAFSLLRQLIFGFFPTVLVLYLFYYNLLTLSFGLLGKRGDPRLGLWKWTLIACLCTACFTVLDNVITPLWYGYSKEAFKIYFFASFTFMLPQVACTAATVGCLFLPLQKAFSAVKRELLR